MIIQSFTHIKIYLKVHFIICILRFASETFLSLEEENLTSINTKYVYVQVKSHRYTASLLGSVGMVHWFKATVR